MSEDSGWDPIPSKGERVERTRCGVRLRGTVWYSDHLQVLVAWDNGESGSLRVGAERFRIVDQPGEQRAEQSPNGAAARPDGEQDDRELPPRCLACAAVLEAGLIGGGSLRCLDCRAANAPLDPTLVAAWQATGARL